MGDEIKADRDCTASGCLKLQCIRNCHVLLCLLRTTTYSALEVSRSCAIEINIVIDIDIMPLSTSTCHLGAVVALSVEYRTYDQKVVGSSLGRARGIKTLGKFFTPVCLCSPSSISSYRPKGGDALRLGSKGRYGSCVGGR